GGAWRESSGGGWPGAGGVSDCSWYAVRLRLGKQRVADRSIRGSICTRCVDAAPEHGAQRHRLRAECRQYWAEHLRKRLPEGGEREQHEPPEPVARPEGEEQQ